MTKFHINLLGLPYDEKSSFQKGSRKAPDQIRKILHNGSSNYITELGVDLENDLEIIDHGDLKIKDYHQVSNQIESKLDLSLPSLFLGGDHSVSFPIVEALSRKSTKFDILHFDAHPDLYDEFEGDRFSHACPFARIMEKKLVKRLVSVGIRTLPLHLKNQAEKYNVEIIMMKDVSKIEKLVFDDPIYISVDLDAFDPAFAPGVSHPEPGGFSSRQFLNFLHQIKVPVVGADIVELNPDRDCSEITAALAAKLLKELAGLMFLNNK